MDGVRRPPLATISADGGVYEAHTRQPVHDHAFASVTLVLSGSLTEVVGAHREDAGPLSVCIKPPGVPHADQVGRVTVRTLRLRVEPAEHAALLEWGAAFASWRWVRGGPLVRALLALAGVGEDVEDRAYDVLALLNAADGAPMRGAPRWLARVREAIDDPGSPTPRVRELAREAGVHPVYLARQFRRFYGCSVMTHVRRVRACAAAALIGGASGLSDVAHRSGYADHAHLSRDFKSLLGVSPSAFRKLASGGTDPSRPTS